MIRQLFGTDGIRGKANHYPMTCEIALQLGKALGEKAKNLSKTPKIVIGKDTRVSGYMLETALVSGIVSRGTKVFLVGPMPTPAIAHLTVSMNCTFGIMISASHNPAQDNGIKVFAGNGIKISDEQEFELENIMLSGKLKEQERIGKAFRIEDARGRYIEFLKTSVKNISLNGLKIVLDCSNGAGYSIAPLVFRELGAKVISINATPDGKNINKNCGSLYPEKLKQEVKKRKADFGFAFDGDADRCIACTKTGKILNGDELLYYFAIAMKQEKELNKTTVITTVMSNMGLDKSLKKHKIRIERTPIGDKHVITRMKRKQSVIGGEQSGHLVFGSNLYCADGIMCALKLLYYYRKTEIDPEKKVNELEIFPQTLLNVKVKEKKPFSKMPELCIEIEAAENKLKGNGRILVRYSGTENTVRIMIESSKKDLGKNLSKKIAECFKKEGLA